MQVWLDDICMAPRHFPEALKTLRSHLRHWCYNLLMGKLTGPSDSFIEKNDG